VHWATVHGSPLGDIMSKTSGMDAGFLPSTGLYGDKAIQVVYRQYVWRAWRAAGGRPAHVVRVMPILLALIARFTSSPDFEYTSLFDTVF